MSAGLQKALEATANRLGRCGITITPTGIKFSRSLEFEEFGDAMDALLFLDGRFKTIINFGLGDLYNRLGLKHGEKRAQITDRWGEGWYQRFSKLGGIAQRIPENRRQGYALQWHIYESAGTKSLPEDIRTTMLETAVEFKKNGQHVKREDLRESIAPYQKPRDTAKPQFTSGLSKNPEDDGLPIAPSGVRRAPVQIFAGENLSTKTADSEVSARLEGGKFGATADQESQPLENIEELKGGDRNERSETDACIEIPARAGQTTTGTAASATVGAVEEQSKEGNQGDGGLVDYRKEFFLAQSENERLKAKLNGIWESAVELDEDHMKALDKIVKHRRSKFPKDDIDRQSEVQAAIRRRWDEITRSHKAK